MKIHNSRYGYFFWSDTDSLLGLQRKGNEKKKKKEEVFLLDSYTALFFFFFNFFFMGKGGLTVKTMAASLKFKFNQIN